MGQVAKAFLIENYGLQDRVGPKLAVLSSIKCKTLEDYPDFYLRLTQARAEVLKLDPNSATDSFYLRTFNDALPCKDPDE